MWKCLYSPLHEGCFPGLRNGCTCFWPRWFQMRNPPAFKLFFPTGNISPSWHHQAGNLSRPSASVRRGGERGAGMEHQFPCWPCWTQRRVGGSCPLGVWLEEGGHCQNSFLLLDDPCPVLWPGEYTALEAFFVCVCWQFQAEPHEGPQGLPITLPQVLSPLSSPPPSFHLSVFLYLIIVCVQGFLVVREGTWEKWGYSIWVQQEVSTP